MQFLGNIRLTSPFQLMPFENPLLNAFLNKKFRENFMKMIIIQMETRLVEMAVEIIISLRSGIIYFMNINI